VRINKAPAGFKLIAGDAGKPTVYAYNDGTPLTPGNGYYVVGDDTDNGFAIRRVTTDLRIVVPVTAETFTVNMSSAAPTWTSSGVSVATRCPATTSTSDNLYNIVDKTVHAGDTVKVTLSGAAALTGANYSLKATDSNGAELTVTKTTVGNGTATFTFTMPAGNVTLAPSYSAPAYDVIWKNTIGVDYSAIDDNIPGEDFTFRAAAQKGYKLNGITASRNGIVRNLGNGVGGIYTVGKDVTGTGLTITFDTAPVEGSLTVSAVGKNGVARAISTTLGAVTPSSAVTFTKTSYAQTIVITVNDNWSNLDIKAVGCDVSTSANNTNNVTTLEVKVYQKDATLSISLQ